MSTVHRIEIHPRDGHTLPVRIVFIEGDLRPADLERLADEALVDDVIETWSIGPADRPGRADPPGWRAVEVSPRPGVTDAVAETVRVAATMLGIEGLLRTATAERHLFDGGLDDAALTAIARRELANEVVQQWCLDGVLPPPFAVGASPVHEVETVPVRTLDPEALLALSASRRLSLDLDEMTSICEHYQSIDRDPTDLELEMIAQTWSEHCVHKTFRASITLQEWGADGLLLDTRVIDGMMKSFLKVPTAEAAKSWVRSAFVDNAGIVRFDEEFDVAIKVETHNHPSAIEPFGGANTGVGGCVRDILGVSARPLANTDVLCFGPPNATDVPAGALAPARVREGVVAGIEDYGNKMGLPTVAGAVVYDAGYTANPLVYVGCVGLLPHGSHPTEPQIGDRIVVIGGRTGRDGLRGATFSSMEMQEETQDIAGTSVQIGHPIHEKQVMEVVCDARDARLYTAITDCGAGGLSSAIGEMAATLGATVQLKDIPTKYPGLQPWELWLSEAQERMVLAVPDDRWSAFCAVAARHGVEAVTLGRFTGDGGLTVKAGDNVVGALSMHFLHTGMPRRSMTARYDHPAVNALRPVLDDPASTLLALLGSDDLCSREPIVRRFDHEVQGGTFVKPLVGPAGDGPGNGAVLVPREARARGRLDRGLALGCGVHPWYGRVDPYRMAWAVIDEALRNVVVLGGDPDQVSLLDNFCWGNPQLPDRLGALVRCGEGCRDASLALAAPWVSGKDSLNNEYTTADGERRAIPGTLLVTALAIVPEVRRISSALRGDGTALLLVGETHGELGGSTLARHLGLDGGEAPRPVTDLLTRARAVHGVIGHPGVRAAHDVSEGGLVVALAEMCIGGRTGAHVHLDTDELLARSWFGESSSRYLLEVDDDAVDDVLAALGDTPVQRVGEVGGGQLVVEGSGARMVVDVEQLVRAHTRIQQGA